MNNYIKRKYVVLLLSIAMLFSIMYSSKVYAETIGNVEIEEVITKNKSIILEIESKYNNKKSKIKNEKLNKVDLGYSTTPEDDGSCVEFIPYVIEAPIEFRVASGHNTGYDANCIYYNGSKIYMRHSGYGFGGYSESVLDGMQWLIDSGYAIIVGPSFSPYDGLPNYIMGHNPGVMGAISDMRVGSQFVITDSAGNAYNYKVICQGRGSYEHLVLSSGLYAVDVLYDGYGGEGIFIQFCLNGHQDTLILQAVLNS